MSTGQKLKNPSHGLNHYGLLVCDSKILVFTWSSEYRDKCSVTPNHVSSASFVSFIFLQKQLWPPSPHPHQPHISAEEGPELGGLVTLSAMPLEATRGQGRGAEGGWFRLRSEDCDHPSAKVADFSLEARFRASGRHLGSPP